MIKNGIIIGMGMSAGALILLFATPWLARAYSPQEFGSLAIFMAIMSVLSSVSCLRHDSAILVVQDSRVNSTIQLAFIYVVVCSLLGGLTFCLIAPEILSLNYLIFKSNKLQLIIGSIGAGAVLVACALSMRREEYGLNALIRAIQGPAYVVLALFFGVGLVNGWAMGWTIAGCLSFIYLLANTRFSGFKPILNQAINLKEYSLRLTPTFLLDSLALSLPIFFINFNYLAKEVGNYSQINRLIAGPLLLVSAVIGQILLEKTGKYYRSNISSLKIFKISIYILSAISFAALIIIILAGQYLIQLILGSDWRSDTTYLILIAVPILCKTIISPITCVFLTHEKTRYIVNWQTLYFFITLASLSVATLLKVRMEIFLTIYACGEIALYLLYYYWAHRVVKMMA